MGEPESPGYTLVPLLPPPPPSWGQRPGQVPESGSEFELKGSVIRMELDHDVSCQRLVNKWTMAHGISIPELTNKWSMYVWCNRESLYHAACAAPHYGPKHLLG